MKDFKREGEQILLHLECILPEDDPVLISAQRLSPERVYDATVAWSRHYGWAGIEGILEDDDKHFEYQELLDEQLIIQEHGYDEVTAIRNRMNHE